MTTLDQEHTPQQLEEELHDLERDEKALERRAEHMSLVQGLTGIFSVVALILGISALVVAFIANGKSNNGNSVTRAAAPVAATGGGTGAMPGGMANGGTAAQPGLVRVTLGDMWVRPNVTSVPAGKVTFVASNMGHLPHELMVERTPLKMEGPGKPVESAAQAMMDDMQPGQSGKMVVRLKPGNYQLFCNVPGHYAAGQHVNFTVTKG